MTTWLVTLKKTNTLDDINNGVLGAYSMKTVLVHCRCENVYKKVIKDEGYEIDSVQDWDLLQQKQMAENIKYILGGI
jgi:hypothetical protein